MDERQERSIQRRMLRQPLMSLLSIYCQRDVEVTGLLYKKLVAETDEKKFSADSVLLEHQTAAIIAKQERNGFRLTCLMQPCYLLQSKESWKAFMNKCKSAGPV